MRGGLTHRGSVAALVCCVLPLSAGCGSGGATSSSVAVPATTPTVTRAPSPAAQARAAARAERRERIRLERTFAPNPYPEPPASRPHPRGRVDRLVVREIARGHGPALRGDETVYANFVKTFWKSGRKFLVSWGPRRFEYLSLPNEAAGIRRGMIGMRPGGRRVIAMPAAISQAHEPNGGAGYVDARVDIVLRKILP